MKNIYGDITKMDKGKGEVKNYGFGVRHIQALLVFIYLIITFVARGHLGVTIVAMVDHPGKHKANTSQNNENSSNIYTSIDINNTFTDKIAEVSTESYDFMTFETIHSINNEDSDSSTVMINWGNEKSDTNIETYTQTQPEFHYKISSNGRLLFLDKIVNLTKIITVPMNYNKNMQFTDRPDSNDLTTFSEHNKLSKVNNDTFEASSLDVTTPLTNIDDYAITTEEDTETRIFKRSDTKYYAENLKKEYLAKVRRDDDIWSIFTTFQWKKSHQESVQGAFFLGYFILMLPMGMLTQRYGGKIPMQISLFVNGITSLISPWAISWGGWQAACVCRIIQGLAQTGTYPATISMCAAWIPFSERGSLSTYIFSGTVIGTVIAFQVGGFLVSTSWGWPSMFWFTGLLCLLGFVLITTFASATPGDNKFISQEEKDFILGNNSGDSVKKNKVPWKDVFTSKHVWAIFATHVGSGVSFFFLFTQVPSYLHYILRFNVKESGLLSSLPYIANFFASLLFGFLSDYCSNRDYLSVRSTRILFNSIACFGMAANLFLVSFFKSKLVGVACFILALTCHAGIHVGWMINYMDICPNYSSSLVAVGNTMMNVGMIVMPMFVSRIIVDVTNVTQWRVMLLLIGFITILCNLVFIFFMSTDVQPWNNSYQLAAQDHEAVAPKKEDESEDDTPKCSLSHNDDFA